MSSDPTPAEDEPEAGNTETGDAEANPDAQLPDQGAALVAAEIPIPPADEPAVKEPALEEPALEEPALEEPALEEPALEEPAIGEPSAIDPPLEEPVTAAPDAESDMPEITLGQDAPVDASVDPDYVPLLRGKLDRFGVAMGTGRRKTAVARVRISEGSGRFQINSRPMDKFFCLERDREMVQAPLRLVEKLGKVDVTIRVNGGGTTGQTGAIVLGISRALQAINPSLHHALSEAGFLTRDGRMVERKKYGLRKARRGFQFSKR